MTDEHEESSNYEPVEVLSKEIVTIFEPNLLRVKNELKELIQKQNRIYINLQTNRSNYSDDNIKQIQDMLESMKLYKTKLTAIKKQMASIHSRTKNVKKRALNLEELKNKEVAIRIEKRQQEEALIARSQS